MLDGNLAKRLFNENKWSNLMITPKQVSLANGYLKLRESLLEARVALEKEDGKMIDVRALAYTSYGYTHTNYKVSTHLPRRGLIDLIASRILEIDSELNKLGVSWVDK